MRTHVDGLKAASARSPGFSVMTARWQNLLTDEVLVFAAEAALGLATEAVRGERHSVQSRAFDSIWVAVSVVPAIDDKGAMAFFPGGYVKVFNGLLGESGWMRVDRDFAHWICCCTKEGLGKFHLAFIPAKSLSDQPTVLTLPQDLMTSSEKAEAGMG
jgi:hypothetical protein